MKSNVKLLLEFAKGKQPEEKRIRMYSVIGGKKKLLEEYPTDAPLSISIDVYANDEAQLQLQEKFKQ